jgi:predicted transcriptional regulator
MKTPCEIIVWNIVPIIRKEFAKNLIENHDLNQRKVADKLGVTESAKSANKIATENGSAVIEETCRICRFLKSKEFVEGINYACE